LKVSVGKRGRKYCWVRLDTDLKSELSYEGLKRIADYLADYYFTHTELAKAQVCKIATLGREHAAFLVLKDSVSEVVAAVEEVLAKEDSTVPWGTAVIPEGAKNPIAMWSYCGFLLHWRGMSWRDYCKHV